MRDVTSACRSSAPAMASNAALACSHLYSAARAMAQDPSHQMRRTHASESILSGAVLMTGARWSPRQCAKLVACGTTVREGPPFT